MVNEQIDISEDAERRLNADIEDARQVLSRARVRFDNLCTELQVLRAERRERAKEG